ncbi:MAG TPA: hypothetical protein VJV39_26635 [Dongiaceae bacterium]|nr:hypothetical protein [Dongiaceae bacterium]
MRASEKRTAYRVVGAVTVVAGSIGLSGCVVPPGTNLADEYGDWAGFCGIFQYCGSDSDTNRGGGQTATGTSEDSSNGSTGGTSSAPIGD